jgi:hypothetical protein
LPRTRDGRGTGSPERGEPTNGLRRSKKRRAHKRLESNMKHIMNARSRRQLEEMGDKTNACKNLIGAKLEGIKFCCSSRCDANRRTVLKPQPNPITHNKLQVLALLIMLLTHNLLSKDQPIMNLRQELITVTECIRCNNLC